MVISASRRTDVPAYYSDWLMGRLDAGYCLVRNPYDARRSTRVSLASEDVDYLVLWTRDPRPLVPRLRELDDRGIRSYAQMTIVGYPDAIEPERPSLDEAIDALRGLSEAIGPRRVLWRYDPVFVAQALEPDFHRRNFELIASRLEGATSRVTFSLLDEYAGTASRLARSGYPGAVFGSEKLPRAAGPKGSCVALPRKGGAAGVARRELADPAGDAAVVSALPPEPYPELLADLAAMAKAHGMTAFSCAEPYDLSSLGIEAGACVDAALADSLWGLESKRGKASGQRPACRCAASVDIGAYGSCPRGCAYCYASRGRGALEARGKEDESL